MSSFPDHQFPHEPVATRDAAPASWRQLFKRALAQSTWKRNNQPQPDSRAAVKTSSSFSRSHKIIIGLAVAVLLLIAVPIALIIRAESHRPHYYRQGKSVVARGESILGISQASSKPKPTPYRYTLDTPITRPSNPIVFTPPRLPNSAAAVPQQTPSQPQYVTPALPQTPNALPQPPTTANSARGPFAPVVYSARHERHFGGCSGQLTLNTGGLNFHCPENPGDSIQIALNEIGAIDENGVQTLSGKKYHFTITGMSKPAAQQLFANWLHQVR